MSKEAIEFLCEINPSFKNMDINNKNTFGGEFLLYCIDKALKQGQSLPIDSVVGRSEQLVNFLKWVGDGYDFENNAEKIVKEYIDEGN